MTSLYPIKVPRKQLEEAREFQRFVMSKEGYRLPLWQCLTELEVRKRKQKPEGFFGRFP